MNCNATIDYARLMAAFGIVIFHANGPGAQIGYAALPFFLMLTVVTVCPSARKTGFGPYVRARASRLLWPWVVWSIIFGILKLGEVILLDAPVRSEFHLWMLLTGPALHLWFLPFALVTSLAVYPLVNWATEVRRQALLVAALVAGTILVLGLWEHHPDLPIPLTQWFYALSPVLLGLAIAICADRPLWQIGLGVAVCAIALALGWTDTIPQIALAAAGLVLCLNWHLPATRLSRWTAAVSLGVYLAHPLVLSVLQRTTDGHLEGLFRTVAACLGALAMAAAMDLAANWRRRGPYTFP